MSVEMKDKKRVLSIGAHPDDADTSAGGMLLKLRDAGWEVRMLSVTDGSAGTYHMDQPREEVVLKRRAEAAASGRRLGGRYDVLSNEDGRLMPTLEIREELIRYIRRFNPDVVITNRPGDYHADHRNTAKLVQDASFLLTVPRVCDDTPYMKHAPCILYWHDSFKNPEFQTDIIVPMSQARVDDLVALACCHECQYFDWMYWPDHTEKIAWPRDKQIAELRERYMAFTSRYCEQSREALKAKHGAAADGVKHCEVFEICEFGCTPDEEFLRIVEMPE